MNAVKRRASRARHRRNARTVAAGLVLALVASVSAVALSSVGSGALLLPNGFATTAYPDLKRFRPEQFAQLLSTAEIALGTALLMPFVPTGLAGLALTGFSGGLVGLYWRVPGLRKEGDIRPTEAGTPLAKDVWMLGIGVALLVDALTDRK